MTSAVSLVRLVASPISSLDGECREYCVQLYVPEVGLPWKNIGSVFIGNYSYSWKPMKHAEQRFPDIDVTIGDLYDNPSDRYDPYIFARYKISKYAKDIMSGKDKHGTVIPDIFSKPDTAEVPVFIGYD